MAKEIDQPVQGIFNIEKIWNIPRPDRKILDSLMDRFHYPEFITSILINRGINTFEAVQEYTKPSVLNLHSPFYFKDMEKAISRIEKALQEKQGILIFGDKDVDGVTATAILYKFFQKMDANVVYRVPEGLENYGISKEVISWAAMNEFNLVITVDCGISSVEEIEYANSLGLDIIITDHHEPREVIPKAYAIINPKMHDDFYPYRTLCGSSVAFKLVCALSEKYVLNDYHNLEIVFLDIETTGLNPTKDEIIEIGAVKIKNGIKIDEFQSLIKCSTPVCAEVTALNGLTNEMLEKDGIPIREALEKFLNFIGDRKIIGHNIIEFDLKFINNYLKKILQVTLTNPVEDTLKMARVMLKKANDYKLVTIGQNLGVYINPAFLHRSVADSELCAEVYRRLIIGRTNKLMEQYFEFLPLAAIGTIADIMPLTGENRTIVKTGLRLIAHSSIGLILLVRAVNLNTEKITSREISWNISPLLNSPGRIGDASFSVELLISNKIKEAEELVQEILNKDNTRKGVVDDGVGIVNKFLDQETIVKNKLIFISSEEFTRGTTGLLANRLSIQFQLPAVIISIDGKMSSGSVRAVFGFDVMKMLEYTSDLMEQFGGHKSAGGFIIKSDNLEQFKARLLEYMEQFNPEDFKDEISIDAVLDNTDDLTLSMIRYLENILEPTGNGNEVPKLIVKKAKISAFREIGKNNSHSLMNISKNGKDIPVIGWNWAQKMKGLLNCPGEKTLLFDLVVSPEINKYQGVEEVRLNLIDIKPSSD